MIWGFFSFSFYCPVFESPNGALGFWSYEVRWYGCLIFILVCSCCIILNCKIWTFTFFREYLLVIGTVFWFFSNSVLISLLWIITWQLICMLCMNLIWAVLNLTNKISFSNHHLCFQACYCIYPCYTNSCHLAFFIQFFLLWCSHGLNFPSALASDHMLSYRLFFWAFWFYLAFGLMLISMCTSYHLGHFFALKFDVVGQEISRTCGTVVFSFMLSSFTF